MVFSRLPVFWHGGSGVLGVVPFTDIVSGGDMNFFVHGKPYNEPYPEKAKKMLARFGSPAMRQVTDTRCAMFVLRGDDLHCDDHDIGLRNGKLVDTKSGT